jgi:hypothetical protein
MAVLKYESKDGMCLTDCPFGKDIKVGAWPCVQKCKYYISNDDYTLKCRYDEEYSLPDELFVI